MMIPLVTIAVRVAVSYSTKSGERNCTTQFVPCCADFAIAMESRRNRIARAMCIAAEAKQKQNLLPSLDSEIAYRSLAVAALTEWYFQTCDREGAVGLGGP